MTLLTKNTDTLRAEIEQHVEADAVAQGHYWNGIRGCFIGCLTHSNRAEDLTKRFGLPLPLVRICESIFERLPAADAPIFFREIGEAVGSDGRDLTRVHWAFLADVLRHLPQTNAQPVINQVIAGMDLLARGKPWPGAAMCAGETAAWAAWAAAEAWAAWAARAATAAAAEAAWAWAEAAWAAWAAWAAARAAECEQETQRQRESLLRLIREADGGVA